MIWLSSHLLWNTINWAGITSYIQDFLQLKIALHQFARSITIDKYDVTMSIPRVHLTSQIRLSDGTMRSQKTVFGDNCEMIDRF